ncbi:hypothetical protein LCGC14_0306220 [marine sediment metagenome]|uniref:Glycosyltransferase 2-like domain-containing protein n=1 Tax=marine sediment metagenome TaxID=412755 RepID=A0A0F9WV70_9ZZZZ
MNRTEAIIKILAGVKEQDIIVSSTGLISRELYNLSDRDLNFYNMGALGSTLAIGLGLALNTSRKVFVINGDGSALMSLGSLVTHSDLYPSNLQHFILDNNCHESTGGQPTVSNKINFDLLAPNTKTIKITTTTKKPGRIPLSGMEIHTRFKKALSVKIDKPVASILIPCFNKIPLLKWGLYSLSKQECPYPFEVIILNDGLPDGTEELCNEYKDKLNIRYIYTGQRNSPGSLIWRCPGFCLNIGMREAYAEYLILTNAEIFHLDKFAVKKTIEALKSEIKILVKPKGKDDQRNTFLTHVKDTKGEVTSAFDLNQVENLNTEMPFFLGINKSDYLCVGGYDEDFIGWAYDDTDFILRLRKYGCKFINIDSTIVHLYHPRHNIKDPKIWSRYVHNKNLYEHKDRQGVVFSNTQHTWGQLNPKNRPKGNPVSAVREWELKKIPRKVHFYWGNVKLPYLRYLSILSFKMHNPDWEITVYVPEHKYTGRCLDTQRAFDFTGRDYYNNLRSLGINIKKVKFGFVENVCEGLHSKYLSRQEVYRSDFLRWYLLSTVGGLWSDMDIMYFSSMNNLDINIRANGNINTAVSLHPKYKHSVGFMLSGQHNKYYKYILDRARREFNPQDYQSIGVNLINKEFPTVASIEDKFPALRNNVANIDIKTVYAYDALVIPTIYNYGDMGRYTRESLGLHWYAGHHLAKRFINNLTHLNYNDFDSVLSKTVSKVYGQK